MTAPVIEGFIEALRSRGLTVSPAERIDASNAALAVGIESRSCFRVALKITLSKTVEESRLFDRVFEEYFAPPRPGGRRRNSDRPGGSGGGTGGQGRDGHRAAPPKAAERTSEKGGLRRSKGEKLPLREAFSHRTRPGRRFTHEAAGPERGRLRRLVLSDRGPREAGRGPVADPRSLEITGCLSREQEEILAREIPAIIQQIRLRRGRRFREGRRGRLWAKRMIRESLAHGGVPFRLPMKERRPRSPRVLVLVDVSWSVARAAGLFLLICLGLAERLRRAEFYLFVDRMVEATQAVRAWASADPSSIAPREPVQRRAAGGRATPGDGIAVRAGGRSFTGLLRTVPGLNLTAPSDYGCAFFQARGLLSRAGGRDTILVVLGDARTNRRDPLPWAFEEIASRCRRVIWLNPEPRRLWGEDDAVMGSYLPACDVACEVRDLDGLARGVREILRTL